MRSTVRQIVVCFLAGTAIGAPSAFAQGQFGWYCLEDKQSDKKCRGTAACDASWQQHLHDYHGGGSGDGSAAAAIAAAAAEVAAKNAALERERLGKEAFAQGEAAFAAGKFAAAAGFFLTASRNQPNNIAYTKARARALAAHRQSLGGVIDELRGADADQFDGTGVAPTLRALPTVKEPSFADSLAQSFGITVNINDPANVGLKLAISHMEDRIKYERSVLISEGQIPPDPVGLEKSVAAFNEAAKAVRPPDASPVTVEEAKTAYSHYKIGQVKR